MQNHLHFQGHKSIIPLPSNFTDLCEGAVRKFKGKLPQKWDLVFLTKEADKRSRTILSQEDYEVALKLSAEEFSGNIEIRESNKDDCTSFKINNKENIWENPKKNPDSEKNIEKESKPEKKRLVLLERDPNIVPEKKSERSNEEQINLDSEKKDRVEISEKEKVELEFDGCEEDHENLPEELQELEQIIERNLRDFGLQSIEELQVEIARSKEEDKADGDEYYLRGLEDLLSKSEKAESIRSKISSEDKYQSLKEIFDKGLQEFEYEDLSDAQEELEALLEEKKRLSGKSQKTKKLGEVELKIEKLQALISTGEEIEKFRIEDERRQLAKKNEEQLSLFKSNMERLEFGKLDDVKEELKVKVEEKNRLKKKDQPTKRLKEVQSMIEELEDLIAVGESVEKLLAEEKIREDQKIKEQKERDFQEGLKKRELTNLQDAEEELGSSRKEEQRLQEKGKQLEKLKALQAAIKELEDLVLLGKEVEKLNNDENDEEQKEADRVKSVDDPNLSSEREEVPPLKTNPELQEISSEPESETEEGEGEEVKAQGEVNEEKQEMKPLIETLKEDASYMPYCFEKLLILLNVLVLRKFYSEYDESESSEFADEEIPKVLEAMCKRAKVEALDAKTMKHSFEQISLQIKAKDWKSAKSNLSLLLKQIRPLNIKEIERLVEKGSEAATLIKGKDAIIFVGETGAGKSTTILCLSGTQMMKNGDHYMAAEIKNSALAGVTTSASSKSETRYIKCIPIKPKDLGISRVGDIYYLDLPGYGDTAGAEVDISNAVNIHRTISECKSVKPVIIISKLSLGERMKGIKILAHILAGMLPSIQQNTEESPMTYLFTKFTKKNVKSVHKKIQDTLDNLTPEEEADKGFCNIIQDILEKTEEEPQLIDPLASDQVKKIVKNILNSKSISQPDQVFKFSITEESRAIIQKKCYLNQETIRSALERKEFELVAYKLSELRILSELLNLDFVEKVYDESVELVGKHLERNYQTSVEKFNRSLKDGNTLEKKDIEEYNESMKNAHAADILRNGYLSKEAITGSSAFDQNLIGQVNQLLEKIKKSSINDSSLKHNFKKLELLSQYFKSVEQELQNSKDCIINKLDETIESFKSFQTNDEFEKGAQLLKDLDKFIDHFSSCLSEDMIIRKRDVIREFFSANIEETGSRLESMFVKKEINPEQVKKLQESISRLQNAKIHFKNQQFAPNIIDLVYKNLIEIGLNYVQEVNKTISKSYQEDKFDSFPEIEKLFNEVQLIRTIPEIAFETNVIYYDGILESLRGFVHEAKNAIIEELKQIQNHQSDDYDYSSLHRNLLALESMKWLDNYKQDAFLKMKRTIEREVMKHSELQKKHLGQFRLDLDNSNKLESANRVASKLKQISVFQDCLPILSKNQDVISSAFENKIQETLATIRGYLTNWNKNLDQTLDAKRIEKSLSYLQKCHELELFNQEVSLLLQELETFIQASSKKDSEQLEIWFQMIINSSKLEDSQRLQDFNSSIRNSVVFSQPQDEGESDNFSSVSEKQEASSSTSKESLTQNAQMMLKLLKQEIKLKNDFPNLFSIYNSEEKSLVEYWKSKLSLYLQDFSEQLLKLSNSNSANKGQELQKKLLVGRALGVLDELMEGDKFMSLYETYQTRYYEQNYKRLKGYIQSVKSGDYSQLSKILKSLREHNTEEIGCSDQYEELRNCLSESLEDLMDQTKRLTQQAFWSKGLPNAEQLTPIVASLKRLRKAEDYLEEQDLNFPIQNFRKCEDRVKKIISADLNYAMEQYKNLITSGNYAEAEQLRQYVNQICRVLGGEWEETLPKRNNDLDAARNNKVKEIMETYQQMKISDYSYQPPKEVYVRLELAKEDHYYNNSLDSFKKMIKEKCWIEMNRIENLDLTQKSAHLKMIQSLLSSLPHSIALDLSRKLEELEGDLNTIKKKYTNDLQGLKKKPDIKKSAELLKSFKEMNLDEDLEDLEEHILNEVQTLNSIFMKKLQLKDLEGACEVYAELSKYNTHLDVQGINEAYKEARTYFMQIIKNWFIPLNRGQSQLNTFCIDKDSVQEIEQSFLCLVKFIRFRENTKTKLIFEDLLSDDQIENLNALVTGYVKNFNQSYDEVLKNFDAVKIQKAIKMAENCSSLVELFKEYVSENQSDSLSSLESMLLEIESDSSLKEKISQRVLELGEELANIELINDDTNKFNNSRDEFYSQLNRKLSNFEKLRKVDCLEVDTESLLGKCFEQIHNQKEKIYRSLERTVERMLEDEIQQKDYNDFNVDYNNLIFIRKNLRCPNMSSFDPEEIEQKFKLKIARYANDILVMNQSSQSNGAQNVQITAEVLQKLKALALNVFVFKAHIEVKINDILISYKTMKGSMGITKLGKVLSTDLKGHGSRVISDYKIFQGIANSIFNKRTENHGIDYVLKNMTGDGINQKPLLKRYDEYHETYKKLVDQFLKPKIEFDELVSNSKILAGNIVQNPDKIRWDSELTGRIPSLLAHIFAIWTLQNAGSYFDNDDLTKRESYLMQPHAAQVISIFRLLGIGEGKSKLQNNLVQIGTGEGKSITLAVTAIILALFGFNVFSACYSSYLSERDYNAFSNLFNLLGVSQKIKYGTFNKICEDVINQDGDVRKLVENLWVEGVANSTALQNCSTCPSILLIDEVDVFFSKDFYGKLYTPAASIRDPTITKLIDLIWSNKDSNNHLVQVKETDEYRNCCARFPDFEPIIEEAVKDMLSDVKEFPLHEYIVKNDKIGYKQNEQISFKMNCRYQTLFAYYHEHDRQNISQQSLEENKRLIIKCGSFSYAEIIKKFTHIMGVTGTLESLSEMEKKVIKEDYHIQKNTFSPSVFGKNKLSFSKLKDVFIRNEDDYFTTLQREINDRINGKSKDAKRAVLVFFETKQKLLVFLNSTHMLGMKDKIEYITEEANADEKENIIKRATSAGRITFLTVSFGRGTDFVVHDQEVSSNNGVHVVLTFLPEELSEEVQIQGRTARQSEEGSFSMVLLDRSLEKFHVLPEDLVQLKNEGKVLNRLVRLVTFDSVKYNNEYELLDARRNELFARTYKNNEKFVVQAKAIHEQAIKFLQDIAARDLDAIRLFLKKENKGASEMSKSRTMVAIDATFSMDQLLQKTKTTLETTFGNITSTLNDYNIPEDCFQVQLVVYRNYDREEDKLLQFSTWETKPSALRDWLENIKAEGGWGNEAIEVALSHANKQNEKEKISQIILIGDAPANSPDDVAEKREDYGEDYWETTKFAFKTNYINEVKALKENKIPVHSFYIHEKAKHNFTEISNATGGKCASLDIYSDAGATALTNSITEVLLRQIGKENGKGDELAEAFRNKFMQSFTE